MRKLLIEPAARLDLADIWEYIARDSVDAADRVSEKLDLDIRALQRLPGKGHPRNDITHKNILFWTVYSYHVIYQYDEATITIIRVLHGNRDLKTKLK